MTMDLHRQMNGRSVAHQYTEGDIEDSASANIKGLACANFAMQTDDWDYLDAHLERNLSPWGLFGSEWGSTIYNPWHVQATVCGSAHGNGWTSGIAEEVLKQYFAMLYMYRRNGVVVTPGGRTFGYSHERNVIATGVLTDNAQSLNRLRPRPYNMGGVAIRENLYKMRAIAKPLRMADGIAMPQGYPMPKCSSPLVYHLGYGDDQDALSSYFPNGHPVWSDPCLGVYWSNQTGWESLALRQEKEKSHLTNFRPGTVEVVADGWAVQGIHKYKLKRSSYKGVYDETINAIPEREALKIHDLWTGWDKPPKRRKNK